MKRFPTILVARLNKARKHPLALLVCVALVVTAAGLVPMAAHRFRETAHQARLADALHALHLDAASASAADHPILAGATGSPHAFGWIDFPLRWSSFTLPYGGEEGGRTDLRQCLPGLPGR